MTTSSHSTVRKSPRKNNFSLNVGSFEAESQRKNTGISLREIEKPKLNIVVVGHSQLPDHIEEFDGHNVVTLKHPGATLWSLDKELDTLWHLPAHVVILFLGGNEIIYDTPANIKAKFREVINRIQEKLKAHVVVTLIEHRDYRQDKNPRRQANADKYNKVRKYLNKYLTESARAGKYRTVNITASNWNERRPDNIHFTREGKTQLVNKWRETIKKYTEEIYNKLKRASDESSCVVQDN